MCPPSALLLAAAAALSSRSSEDMRSGRPPPPRPAARPLSPKRPEGGEGAPWQYSQDPKSTPGPARLPSGRRGAPGGGGGG
jgi:hypothetical protein